jgi:hypothetical protein
MLRRSVNSRSFASNPVEERPMSKMHVGLVAIALMTIAIPSQPANADAWPTRHHARAHLGEVPVYRYEDSCGCMYVTYVHHRELKYTYGYHFDPRSFDQTEPHYYYGAVKAYPRYSSTPTCPAWPFLSATACY